MAWEDLETKNQFMLNSRKSVHRELFELMNELALWFMSPQRLQTNLSRLMGEKNKDISVEREGIHTELPHEYRELRTW